MGRRLAPLALSEEERSKLRALATRRKVRPKLALRARIVLACAEGRQNKEIAASLGVDDVTVSKWRRRFVERRIEGLRERTRPRTRNDYSVTDLTQCRRSESQMSRNTNSSHSSAT